MDIQWYPGHMTRADRSMQEDIRLVDVVIELLDARAPVSSANPRIDALTGQKARIRLLNKADLADPATTEAWAAGFAKADTPALALDSRSRTDAQRVRRLLEEITLEKRRRDARRGIKNRPVRVMIAGIPNVGKSTFINAFAGRAGAKTGNRPGVTRGKQWISVGRQIDLLDTPGILWPKFEVPSVGVHLACIGAIRDEVFDMQELAYELTGILHARYPGIIGDRYGIDEASLLSGEASAVPASDNAPQGLLPKEGAQGPMSAMSVHISLPEKRLHALLAEIARARGCVLPGGDPDIGKAARILVEDYRRGALGRLSLEAPE